MNYLEYTFKRFSTDEIKEILVAFLDEKGYSGFLEREQNLIAYLPEEKKDEEALDDLLNSLSRGHEKIDYEVQQLPEINWNETWEKGFQPILIDDIVRIRASFHKEDSSYLYDIVIDPKMSFGTGHHETTRLMIKSMLELDFQGTQVLDMGCGTGVLAILASKLGANLIVAVDIDEWSVRNARENAGSNSCNNITVLKGAIDIVPVRKYNIILANINRNVLLDYMDYFKLLLVSGGSLLLSGIMEHDLEIIRLKALEAGFKENSYGSETKWNSIHFSLIDPL